MAKCSLQRVICALLAGGYVTLAIDTMLEHRDVVSVNRLAWTPPLGAALLVLVTAAVSLTWSPRGRRVGGAAGLVSLLLGSVGLVLHNAERFEHGFSHLGPLLPPLLAPAAFCGLGALLWLACTTRFTEAVPAA